MVLGSDFFHVWCADERVRRRALLERADFYLTARPWIRRSDLDGWLARVGRQVGLADVDIATVSRWAARAGNRDLAAQLDRIATQQ